MLAEEICFSGTCIVEIGAVIAIPLTSFSFACANNLFRIVARKKNGAKK